mgnify:CR=1 FL=1
MTSILGISAFYHDSAAALIQNGKIDFRKLDQLVSTDLRGKTKMSPLELSLVLDPAT